MEHARIPEGDDLAAIVDAILQVVVHLLDQVERIGLIASSVRIDLGIGAIQVRLDREVQGNCTVDLARVIVAEAVLVCQPGRIVVRIHVPALGAELAEVFGAGVATQVADQFGHRQVRVLDLTGGQDWRFVGRCVVGHVQVDDCTGAVAGARIMLVSAVVVDVAQVVQVLLFCTRNKGSHDS